MRAGVGISGRRYAAAFGWPSRRRGEKGKPGAEGPLALPKGEFGPFISTASPSSLFSDEIGFAVEVAFRGIAGPPALKESGCREQTRRVSTPALRSKAQ
jgi:hypothetical protein